MIVLKELFQLEGGKDFLLGNQEELCKDITSKF